MNEWWNTHNGMFPAPPVWHIDSIQDLPEKPVTPTMKDVVEREYREMKERQDARSTT